MHNTKSTDYSLATASLILGELYEHNPLFWLPSISGFEYEPYAHQAELLVRLSLRLPIRALIGDDVGLGKTIEAMMLLSKWLNNSDGKALVLVPRAILDQWINELRRIGIIPVVINGPEDPRSPSSKVYISKIDTAKRNRLKDAILSQRWGFIIIDECHKVGIVNGKKTDRYSFVEELMNRNAGANLLMLSATPHRGKNDDYLARLYLLDNYIIRDKSLENNYEFYSLTRNAIVFRRTKDHVNKNYENYNVFPNAALHIYLIEPTRDELMYYEKLDELTRSILRDYHDKINEEARVIPLLAALIDKRGLSSPKAGLNTLRNIIGKRIHVLSPKISINDIEGYLEDEELDVDNDETVNSILANYANRLENYRDSIMKVIEYAERALNSDSRFKAVLSLVNSHVSNGDSVIIFTEYRDTAGYVYDRLIDEHINADVRKLTGDDLQSNINVIDEVKNWLQGCKDEKKPCILVSTDVAAEGLNLQAANVVINYEVPWSPLKIEQRIGRVWRLGQDRGVTAYIVALTSVFEKAIFDVLFTKLLAEISARVDAKTPESVIFSTTVNNKVVYDLTKYEGDLASTVEIERKEGRRTINESLTPYTLWRIYKFEGEVGLNDVVKSVITKMRELRDHYRRLGLSTENASIQDILPTLVGFRDRRELTETVDAVIRATITKLGGSYDEGRRIINYDNHVWRIRRTPIDLLKVLRQIQIETHGSTIPKYVLCTGYGKAIHVYRVCIKINPSTPYCTLVPVVNNEIKTISELLREIPSIINADCIPADDSNLNDDSLRSRVKDHVLKKGAYVAVNSLEKYVNQLVEMKVRERSGDWFPDRRERINDKVSIERMLSVFGGFEISRVNSDVGEGAGDRSVEEKAMEAAMRYEGEHGRDPKDVSKSEHYDIYSVGSGGEVRFIEVKGHADPTLIAELTEDEYNFAMRHHDDYWLYLVFDINRSPVLLTIRDPLSHMDISTIEKRERRYILRPKSSD